MLRLPAILLVAGLVRLAPALWLPVGAGYDIESYRLVTEALLGGHEVYTSVLGRHPYLPFQMYIMGAMASLADATGLPYVVAIKLPALLADVVLTGIIYYAAGRRADRAFAGFPALLYALNPLSLLVTSYHGQFEAVTLLFVVLAWLAWDMRRQERSAVALGFSILNKTWPVVLLPLFLIRLENWRARAIYSLIALAIPVLFVAAYLALFSADPMPMLRRALTHRGVAGYWGPGAILNPAARVYTGLQPVVDGLFGLRNWLLAGGVLFAVWWTRRQLVVDAIVTTLLVMFVVTVGFGIQWLVWPVPFALLAGDYRWLKGYSLAGALMLTVHLYGLHMYPWLNEWLSPVSADWVIRLSAIPAWIIVVLWAGRRLQRAQMARPAMGQWQDSPAG